MFFKYPLLIRLKEDSFATIKEVIIKIACQNATTLYLDGGIHHESLWPRARSLRDIFWAVKYYFPDTTEEEFISIISRLIKEQYFHSQFCITIQQQVLTSPGVPNFYISVKKDSNGIGGTGEVANKLRELIKNY